MRPGQKNRMRGGRGNNNGGGSRRGPNPLTRSYESNGPDVKVRGTPQHIAEKYMQLARDAHSAGDTVMAEAYLQHAEHYYRIIAAAQNAQQVAYNQANGISTPGDNDAVEDEDEFEVAGSDRFVFRTPQSFQPQAAGQNGGQQPFTEGGEQPAVTDGMQAEGGQPTYQQQPRGDRQFGNRRPYEDRGDRPERQDRSFRQDGQQPRQDSRQDGRPERGERQDRGDRNNRRFGRDRSFGDRPQGERPFGDRPGYPPRDGSGGGYEQAQEQPSFASAEQEQPGLPSFITAPARSQPAETFSGSDSSAAAPSSGEETGIRQRRRRRSRSEDAGPENDDAA